MPTKGDVAPWSTNSRPWLDRQPSLIAPPSRAVSGVLRAAKAGSGPEAWSVEDLIELAGGASLGFDVAKTGALTHPSEASWRPRGHVDLLRTVARTAHLPGGMGRCADGSVSSSTMRPNPHRGRLAHQRQQIEETYWWLECIAALWSPISDAEASDAPVGPISESNLPLPTPPTSLHAWFDLMLNAADWSMLRARTSDFDASVAGLHLLKERLDVGLAPDASGVKDVEAKEDMSDDPPRPPAGAEGADVLVTSVDEALGRPSGLTVLSGLDDEAWSMRPADLPWCDRASRVSLGLFDGDLPIRRARYALAQLVAFSFFCRRVRHLGGRRGRPIAAACGVAASRSQNRAMDRVEHRTTCWFTTNEGDDVHGLWTLDGDGALQPRPGGFRNGQAGRAGRARRDTRQRTGLDLDAGRDLHASVNRGALLAAAAPKVLQDRERRQPDLQALETNEVLPWSDAARLQTTTRLNLRPTPSSVGKGRKVASVDGWPHLGSVSTETWSRCPWILALSRLQPLATVHCTRRSLPKGKATRRPHGRPAVCKDGWCARERHGWNKPSASAVKTWVPRTWTVESKVTLFIGLRKRPSGPLAHGRRRDGGRQNPPRFLPTTSTPTGSRSSMRCSSKRRGLDEPMLLRCIDAGSDGRCTGRSHHARPRHHASRRTRRLLQADATPFGRGPTRDGMGHRQRSGEVPTVHFSDDVEPQPLRCRIDRADEVILDEARRQAAIDAGLIGEEGPERLVILRDVKSVIGPRRGKEQERHLRALYDEVQLAAYALAWEAARPNDRVIGVGISSVGAATWHHVELDTAWSEVLEGLELGQVTSHLWQTHPSTLRDGTPSSSFRRWLEERALTMAKAVQAASEGHVNPTPSKACSTCSVASACGVAHLEVAADAAPLPPCPTAWP